MNWQYATTVTNEQPQPLTALFRDNLGKMTPEDKLIILDFTEAGEDGLVVARRRPRNRGHIPV